MGTFNINVNGKLLTVDADPDTPLLWVLRDNLNLVGTKYGCGIAQITDGIGNPIFGNMQFSNGRAKLQNFDQYRLIRIDEVPAIDIFFVESLNDPTGLGEPTLTPAGGAIANALAAATGKRLYHQPFVQQL